MSEKKENKSFLREVIRTSIYVIITWFLSARLLTTTPFFSYLCPIAF